MNAQEQQVIESLFERIQQGAAQGGPRDPQAEALIQQKVQGFTGAPYYMAQTMVVQEHALQQAEQRIRALEQQVQGGRSFTGGSFAGGSFAGPTSGYQPGPAPQYQQPAPQQSGGMGGFLAGAGKMALGIGGGILVADAAMGLARGIFGGGGGFGGGFGGFGYGGDEGAFERGYEAGQQDDDRDQGDTQQYSNDDNQQSGWDDQGDQGGDWGGGDDSSDSGSSW